jgi:hypothetical protein
MDTEIESMPEWNGQSWGYDMDIESFFDLEKFDKELEASNPPLKVSHRRHFFPVAHSPMLSFDSFIILPKTRTKNVVVVAAPRQKCVREE